MKKPNFWQSLILDNPPFVQYLGICAVLGVSTSLDNALGMSVIVLFVLLVSNILISLLRKLIPNEIRIPVFIVIIATAVTVAEMFIKAYAPILYQNMGSFISLVVVNCIILGRAEACASKQPVGAAIKDAFVMGLGYAISQFSMAIIRSFFAEGGWSLSNPLTNEILFKITILPESMRIGLFAKPIGGFITFGILAALFASYKMSFENKQKQAAKAAAAPKEVVKANG